jgi:hypothetical protein
MLRDLDLLARQAEGARFKMFTKIDAWRKLRRHFKPQFAPPGLTFERFLQTLQGMTDHEYGRGRGDGTFTYKTLLVAGMHFMDSFNYAGGADIALYVCDRIVALCPARLQRQTSG